jgi:hypothetical protein
MRLARAAWDRGLRWLSSAQAPDGTFGSHSYGLMSKGESLTPFVLLAAADPPPRGSSLPLDRVQEAFEGLMALRHPTGALGFAGPVPDYPVYATAMAISAASRWSLAGWRDLMAPSIAWLQSQQYRREDGWAEHRALGGFGMGSLAKPVPPNPGHVDLSMTRYAIEALAAAGLSADGPVLRAARGFVLAARSHDGGFLYSPVEPALNKGPQGPEGQSGYGSATCDGLLALAALGADPTETTFRDALDALKGMHRVDENPRVARGPVPAFATAMVGSYRAGAAEVFRRFGGPAGWQQPLARAVVADQHEDGRWQNPSPLQKEDDPVIATSYALAALKHLLHSLA